MTYITRRGLGTNVSKCDGNMREADYLKASLCHINTTICLPPGRTIPSWGADSVEGLEVLATQ